MLYQCRARQRDLQTTSTLQAETLELGQTYDDPNLSISDAHG